MDAPPRTPTRMRLRFLLGASLLFAVGLVWVLRSGGLPVLPRPAELALVPFQAVFLHALLYTAALYLRSHRWSWLLAPIARVPLRRVVAVSFIGYGALVLLPFRAGEAVRPLLIRQRGLSGWAAAGTVAAERIVDGLILSIFLLLGLMLAPHQEPLPDRIGDLSIPAAAVPKVAYFTLLVFAAAFAAIFIFWFWRDFARRLTERIVGFFAPKLATRLADMVERIASGLGFLPRLRYSVPFVAATIAYFVLYTWATQILLSGVGLGSGGFARSMVIVGVLHIGVLLPNAPGYFGTFQVALYAGLSLYYAPADVMGRGGVLVFYSYVVQVGVVVALGALALLVFGASLSETLGSLENASLDVETRNDDQKGQALPGA